MRLICFPAKKLGAAGWACAAGRWPIATTTASLVRAVYRELGIEAMRENAEWVAVYRQRPIQPLP